MLTRCPGCWAGYSQPCMHNKHQQFQCKQYCIRSVHRRLRTTWERAQQHRVDPEDYIPLEKTEPPFQAKPKEDCMAPYYLRNKRNASRQYAIPENTQKITNCGHSYPRSDCSDCERQKRCSCGLFLAACTKCRFKASFIEDYTHKANTRINERLARMKTKVKA